MSRFIAVEDDDGTCRIYDEEGKGFLEIEFHGDDALDVATGCAHALNKQSDQIAEAMDEWLNLK